MCLKFFTKVVQDSESTLNTELLLSLFSITQLNYNKYALLVQFMHSTVAKKVKIFTTLIETLPFANVQDENYSILLRKNIWIIPYRRKELKINVKPRISSLFLWKKPTVFHEFFNRLE